MLGACLAWGDMSLSGGRRPQPPGPGEGGALWLGGSEGTQEKRRQGRLPLVGAGAPPCEGQRVAGFLLPRPCPPSPARLVLQGRKAPWGRVAQTPLVACAGSVFFCFCFVATLVFF